MTATDAQVRIAMRERRSGKTQEQAAAKANLRSRKTVAKYEQQGRMPSELKKPRTYSTREDAFAEDWHLVRAKLEDASTLEPTPLFAWLREQRPGRYRDSQLRTFQRRVQRWKALESAKVLSLPQVRQPGEMLQADGTSMNALRVTVQGEPFDHILMHTVLPYSNWEWGRVVQSESLMAIQLGVGSALRELEHIPEYLQMDHSSAATHELRADEAEELGSHRGFNPEYLAWVEGVGMVPRSTHVASPDENGDVESAHRLKGAIEQHLLIRGSRDFESVAAYEQLLWVIMRRRNVPRQERLAEELAVMRPLPFPPPPAVRERRVRVSDAGTARVMNRAYSLPSGLKNQHVKAIISEWQVEFWYGGRCVRRAERKPGTRSPSIDYRHVISSLLRKPGGFRNYRYLEALFPRQAFSEAWEAFKGWMSPRRADLAYLRVLCLAAHSLEDDVTSALALLLAAGDEFDDESVRSLVEPSRAEVPAVDRESVDLERYDDLLAAGRAA